MRLAGRLAFRYSIVPLAGEPDRTDLFVRAQRLAGGLRAVRTDAGDLVHGVFHFDQVGFEYGVKRRHGDGVPGR
jgi:hypothetical protein